MAAKNTSAPLHKNVKQISISPPFLKIVGQENEHKVHWTVVQLFLNNFKKDVQNDGSNFLSEWYMPFSGCGSRMVGLGWIENQLPQVLTNNFIINDCGAMGNNVLQKTLSMHKIN